MGKLQDGALKKKPKQKTIEIDDGTRRKSSAQITYVKSLTQRLWLYIVPASAMYYVTSSLISRTRALRQQNVESVKQVPTVCF